MGATYRIGIQNFFLSKLIPRMPYHHGAMTSQAEPRLDSKYIQDNARLAYRERERSYGSCNLLEIYRMDSKSVLYALGS